MPTTLSAGDIAFVGVQGDGSPERFAVVLLRDIEAGTAISFTDNGWLSTGALRTGEGVVTYTAPAAVAAGTILTYAGAAGDGWSAQTGSLALNNSGDQVIAFQGTLASPTALLAAIQTNNSAWESGTVDAQQSNLPGINSPLADLSLGTYAVAIGVNASTERDNGAYTGPTSGTAADLLAAINTVGNWTVTTNTSTALAFPSGPFAVGGSGGASAGLTLMQSGGGTAVSEQGATTDTISLVLGAVPTGDVTVTVSGAGSDFSLSATSFTFTTLDWNVARTLTITAIDDMLVEGSETVTLSFAISGPGGYASLPAQTVSVGIVDNDFAAIAIGAVQGVGHASPFAGQTVTVRGNITAIDGNGFYVQDPGDGDLRTSDGIFVFTNSAPAASLAVGDGVLVTGQVSEFRPGSNSNNLTITEVVSPSVTEVAPVAGVTATVIGAGGRMPPTSVTQDDNFTSFDIATDGIDFWESLEGMLLTVTAPRAVSGTNGFGETWIVADGGANASGINARGSITLMETDNNPERIQIDTDSAVLPGFDPTITTGDTLSDVTGVLSYNFGNFELVPTQAFTVIPGSLTRETTTLARGADSLLVAEYNIENFIRFDTGKLATLAQDITGRLNRPDIVALQEVQDDTGPTNDGTTSSDLNLQALVDAIGAAGGPIYRFAYIAPINNTSGGQPGGNIRNAFLYDESRVDLLSLSRVAPFDAAFTASRVPLVGTFAFNGDIVTLVNVHFSSKGGSSTYFGAPYPPIDGGVQNRIDQAAVTNAYVDDILAARPNAKILVLGDHNAFSWEAPQRVLRGEVLADLTTPGTLVLHDLGKSLPERERYTYVFDGNAQALDHTLATDAARAVATYDVVHINAEFPDGSRTSDHDPAVTRLVLDRASTITFTLLVDTDGDTIAEDASLGLLYQEAAATALQDSTRNDDSTLRSLSTFAQVNGDVTVRQAALGSGAVLGSPAASLAMLDWGAAGRAVLRKTATDLQPLGAVVNGFTGTGLVIEDFEQVSIRFGGAASVMVSVAGNDRGSIVLGAGQDTVTAGSGDDEIDGGAGADSIEAGAGNDRVTHDAADILQDGGAGHDTLVLATALRVDLTAHDQVAGGGRQAGFEAVDASSLSASVRLVGSSLRGGAADDNLFGTAGNDSLVGGGGRDWLRGEAGADLMEGGDGNDTYVVDDAGDVLVELSGGGNADLAYASVSYLLPDHVERMILSGLNLTGTGNSGDNGLRGGAGNDVLFGMAGRDTLRGDSGRDSLHGGEGSDTFHIYRDDLGSGSPWADAIMDFVGAGGWSGTENDLLVFFGFSSAASLQFQALDGGDPTRQLYRLTDVGLDTTLLIVSTNGARLVAGDYGFYA